MSQSWGSGPSWDGGDWCGHHDALTWRGGQGQGLGQPGQSHLTPRSPTVPPAHYRVFIAPALGSRVAQGTESWDLTCSCCLPRCAQGWECLAACAAGGHKACWDPREAWGGGVGHCTQASKVPALPCPQPRGSRKLPGTQREEGTGQSPGWGSGPLRAIVRAVASPQSVGSGLERQPDGAGQSCAR